MSPSPTIAGILAAAVAAAAAPSAGHVDVQGRRLAVLVPPLRNLTAETNGNCGRSACSNERELRRCPQTCGVALDIIDELSSRGRLPRQGTRPARHELIANLQSKVEELTIASGGSRADVPLAVHDALVDVAVSLNDQRAAHGDPRRPGFDQLRAFIYAASSPRIGTAKRSGSDTTARRTLFASVGPSDAPPSPPLPLEARCASVGCVASSINSAFSAVEQAHWFACTHTRAHARAHTRTRTHARTHAHTHARTRRAYTCICARTHTRMHTSSCSSLSGLGAH